MEKQQQASVKSADKEVLIRHTFNAPRELVFKAWTDPEQLKNWYAPNGCEIFFKQIDVREGGTYHSCVRTEQGECWCTGTYLQVDSPNALMYTMEIANEKGEKVSAEEAGHDPAWPTSTVVTITFDEVDGKTVVILAQTVSAALAKTTGAYPSWLQMLERLEDLVNVQ